MSEIVSRLEKVICNPDIHIKAANEEFKDIISLLVHTDEILHAEIPYKNFPAHMYHTRIPEVQHRSYLLDIYGNPIYDQELHTPFAEKTRRPVQSILFEHKNKLRLNVHVAPNRAALIGVVMDREPFIVAAKSIINFSVHQDYSERIL